MNICDYGCGQEGKGKMRVAFYSNRMKGLQGDLLERRGLGGSESALINLTTWWKKQYPNDEIIIYNDAINREKNNYFGVIYKEIKDFYLEIRNLELDAFVSLRDYEPFKVPYINSRLKCFWSEDDMNEVDLQRLSLDLYNKNRLDLIFAVSDYSLNNIKQVFSDVDIVVQRNGYRSDWITHTFGLNRQPIACYTSTPFRGLDVLANLWNPIYQLCIQRQVQPTLRVYSGMSLYGQPEDNFKELYNYLKSQPGVEFYGAVSQYQLYQELKKCKLMLYPNHFLETSSMAVLEALANNVWVITTDLGALGEQVKNNVNGNIISGDANSPAYHKQFIDFAVESFCNPSLSPKSEGLIFSWREQSSLMRERILERI